MLIAVDGDEAVDGFDCTIAGEDLRAELKALYGHPDNVNFYVALLTEDNGPNPPMLTLLRAMVALDASNQALNNPLLFHQVFNARTFSIYGMEAFEDTHTLPDILVRNPGAKARQRARSVPTSCE